MTDNTIPDSQNKQGEQIDIKSIAETHAINLANGLTDEIGAITAAILEYKSLLSQQHAPSKEVEERMEELLNKYFPHTAWGGNVRTLARYLMNELATELTKGREAERVKHEARLKAVKEDRDAILDDRDSLRQQLAEVESKMPLWVEKNNRLNAQNIALSAVVEKMRGALLLWFYQGSSELASAALSLQPDWSLYGRIVNFLDILDNNGLYDSAELTQLLADLGQGK